MSTRASVPALMLVAACALPAAAQTSSPTPNRSVTGLASVSLSGNIGPAPSGTAWGAGLGYEPFVTDHLQIGGGVSYAGATGPFSSESGSANVTARYLFGNDPRSAPFAAAALATNGGQQLAARNTATLGLGWLHFITPLTALEAQVTATRVASGGKTLASFRVAPSTFAFGPGTEVRGSPQLAGSFDWSAGAGIDFSPDRSYSISGDYRPFLTPYLQMGLGGSAGYQTAGNGVPNSVTSYAANALVRLYYPADWRLRPFVDVFGTEGGGTSGPAGLGRRTHGASFGARYYLTPELAVDARVLQTMTDQVPQGPLPPPRTTFGLGLTLHRPR
jgi:hypothetical protein